MEQLHPEHRPCAHCGGMIAADDTTCATCGRAYIPDAGYQAPRAARGSATASGGRRVAATPPAPAMADAGVSDESRAWAIGAYLSALAGVLLGGVMAFVGPLVVWLLRRDARDAFATEHAREALNFNLSVIIYAVAFTVVSVVAVIVTLGLALLVLLPALAVAFIGYLVVTVRAAMAAAVRAPYRYPLTLPLVR